MPNKGFEMRKKTEAFNISVDFDLFKGKLSGSFDSWSKKSKDQLLSLEVTSTNGAKSVTINGGDLTNRGWELGLSATPIKTKDFKWNFTFNTSKTYNEVATTANQIVSYENGVYTGKRWVFTKFLLFLSTKKYRKWGFQHIWVWRIMMQTEM